MRRNGIFHGLTTRATCSSMPRCAHARRSLGLEEFLAAQGVEQQPCLYSPFRRPAQRLFHLVGRTAGVPDVELHLDAGDGAIHVRDDLTQDRLGSVEQAERRVCHERHAGRAERKAREAVPGRRERLGLGTFMAREPVHDGGQAGVEGAREVGAALADRSLADQRVGDGANDRQQGGEQQPGEGTARRVPAEDDAHADACHDGDVQCKQGGGFEVLGGHDPDACVSLARPGKRAACGARSSRFPLPGTRRRRR